MTTYKQRIGNVATQANESAREVWLAGLGAFSRAQTEGAKLFDSLVKEGEKLETKARKDVSDRVVSIRGDVESRVSKVRNTANANFKKLEKVFEERVARVLARLGVPTAEDIQQLSKRVETLSKEVKALNAADTSSKAA